MTPLASLREEPARPDGAVFVDHSGRRRRWFTAGAVLLSVLALTMTATLVGAVLADTPLSDDGWPGWPANPSATIFDDAAAGREPSSAASRTPRAPSRSASRREPGPRASAAPSRTRPTRRSAPPATTSARPSRTPEPRETAPATGRETRGAPEPEPSVTRDLGPPRESEPAEAPEPSGPPSPGQAAIASGAPA
ncbi:hypothetical protein ACQEUU_22365 [Nonomuraea sp. CA-218870]|uniref:hypothetical protein n=1 Tax=Nonomuraea sp. CA-218870 TaxID=3239998 RepID=UPI003D93F592